MDQAVHDGVGHSGVTNDFVPLADGKLAGDECGSQPLTVIEYFEHLPVLFARIVADSKIVNDDQSRSLQLLEQCWQAAVGLGCLDGSKELRRTVVEGAVAIPAGLVAQSAT